MRLYGIDAPEMNTPGGKESKAALQFLIKPGDIVNIAVGAYFFRHGKQHNANTLHYLTYQTNWLFMRLPLSLRQSDFQAIKKHAEATCYSARAFW